MPQTINFDVTAGVATITLNLPEKKNPLTPGMRTEMLEAVNVVSGNSHVKALIITGAGGAFSSGGDINGMAARLTAEAGRRRVMDAAPLITRLIQLDCPVIAVVDGAAFGAGFGLALTADFILASSRARFCLSFAKLGLVPDFGVLHTLPKMVGLQRAKELIFSSREIGTAEAREIGIVYEVHESDVLPKRALELAQSFVEASPIAVSLAKRALNIASHTDLATMLAIEADAQGIAFSSDYLHEAVERYRSKQALRFTWPKRSAP